MKRSSYLNNLKVQSGQSIVIIAFATGVLLVIVALGIDGSKFYSERRIAQNAADPPALAAIYYYQNNSTANNKQTMIEADRVAELDQIPDPDGVTSDGINANMTASWLDADRKTLIIPIPGCITGTTCFPSGSTSNPLGNPAKANRVVVNIPYSTFLGGFVGTSMVTAQASAIARIVSSTTSVMTQNNKSAWVSGGDCNNLSTKIGYYL